MPVHCNETTASTWVARLPLPASSFWAVPK